MNNAMEIDDLTAAVDLNSHPKALIEGISEPVVCRYFETLNAGNFQMTAVLFAADGVMYPPFESAVVGREAIALYLESEARGMQLQPKQGVVEPQEAGETQVRVSGKVQTALFGVNVSWNFVLNPASEILSVRIKLLASPQELLSLKR